MLKSSSAQAMVVAHNMGGRQLSQTPVLHFPETDHAADVAPVLSGEYCYWSPAHFKWHD